MKKLQLTERALFRRCSRRLAQDGRRVIKVREISPLYSAVGPYVVIGPANEVESHSLTLAKLAAQLGVVKPYEVVT